MPPVGVVTLTKNRCEMPYSGDHPAPVSSEAGSGLGSHGSAWARWGAVAANRSFRLGREWDETAVAQDFLGCILYASPRPRACPGHVLHCASLCTTDSASSAWTSARAAALPQARGPIARATGRPSRPTTTVVGRPITPYAFAITPSRSRTSG